MPELVAKARIVAGGLIRQGQHLFILGPAGGFGGGQGGGPGGPGGGAGGFGRPGPGSGQGAAAISLPFPDLGRSETIVALVALGQTAIFVVLIVAWLVVVARPRNRAIARWRRGGAT